MGKRRKETMQQIVHIKTGKMASSYDYKYKNYERKRMGKMRKETMQQILHKIMKNLAGISIVKDNTVF